MLEASSQNGRCRVDGNNRSETSELRVEAHLLDFADDLYGERAQVRFVHFLRSERKFDGIDALVAQLKHDVEAARHALEVS